MISSVIENIFKKLFGSQVKPRVIHLDIHVRSVTSWIILGLGIVTNISKCDGGDGGGGGGGGDCCYNRTTTTPKTIIKRINPAVIKKLNLRSGNMSVSRTPLVFITG